MKDFLTPTQYQSLPVNEQCNWKEQWQYLTNVFKNGVRFETGKTEEWLNYDGEEDILNETRLIYIPNPESILNAEMWNRVSVTGIDSTDDYASKYALIKDCQTDNSIYGSLKNAYIDGYSQGKKDHNKEVIDIVEAELKKHIDKANRMLHNEHEQQYRLIPCALTDVLTKLKEIK